MRISNSKLVTALVVAALMLLFIFQNTEVVEIRLLFWTVAISRGLMMFLVLVIGAGLGWLFHSLFQHRNSSRRPVAER